MLKIIYFRGRDAKIAKKRRQRSQIRKVKAVSPSPFYDGKYHPPFIQQQNAALLK
jgi:hypothetical protein